MRSLVRRALSEDRVRSDRTTRALLGEAIPAHADVIAQSACVVSGVGAAASTARALGVRARELVREGDRISRGRVVLTLEGDARKILAAERTLLNLLMHLSGVATATAEAVKRARTGPNGLAVYATRKTLPGLRDLEKAAVVHGGGFPHRRDLSDGVLIKNNHLALVPLTTAVARVRRKV
ncbi:MAG: carboxylating.nicotinate-nucleotide diphosphorylase, partial [Thermoplasmata archaeon]|nr:carboxylating.nicotinate-nucleotide diphosphorylase [Thermoplasmata archaeon]